MYKPMFCYRYLFIESGCIVVGADKVDATVEAANEIDAFLQELQRLV